MKVTMPSLRWNINTLNLKLTWCNNQIMSHMMILLLLKHRRKDGESSVHLIKVLMDMVILMILVMRALLLRRRLISFKVTQKYEK